MPFINGLSIKAAREWIGATRTKRGKTLGLSYRHLCRIEKSGRVKVGVGTLELLFDKLLNGAKVRDGQAAKGEAKVLPKVLRLVVGLSRRCDAAGDDGETVVIRFIRGLPADLRTAEIADIVAWYGGEKKCAVEAAEAGRVEEADRAFRKLRAIGGEFLFDLCRLHGDCWRRNNRFNEAIEPYEEALRLRPSDLHAVLDVARIQLLASQGDPVARWKRAYDLLRKNVGAVDKRSLLYAQWRHWIGTAWLRHPSLPRTKRLSKAEAEFRLALKAWGKRRGGPERTMIINDLAIVVFSKGGRKNQNEARRLFQNALLAWRKQNYPREWALARQRLGNCWSGMNAQGAERLRNLHNALRNYQESLTVYARQKHPIEWARVRYTMGDLFIRLMEADAKAADEWFKLGKQAILDAKKILTVKHRRDHRDLLFNFAELHQKRPNASEDDLRVCAASYRKVLRLCSPRHDAEYREETQLALEAALKALADRRKTRRGR